ncbi:MAG TPA: hypothetical protein VJ345_08930, partial [Anaerolineales bacterium]|nr:hypothetical protein [Anaerolineales bacterium]
RPPTAQSLISSARLRRWGPAWPACGAKCGRRDTPSGFSGKALPATKIVFLEEYMAQSSTRGHSLEISACILFPGVYTESEPGWTYTTTVSALFGASLGWSYQLGNNLSLGAYLANAMSSLCRCAR